MKKHIGTTLVALCFYIVVYAFFIGPIFSTAIPGYLTSSELIVVSKAMGPIILIITVIGIIGLNRKIIYFAIIIFILFGLQQLAGFIGFILVEPSNIKMIKIKAFLCFPSLISSIYLLSPSFRSRVKEHEKCKANKKLNTIKI
jgi:hypothetical protein